MFKLSTNATTAIVIIAGLAYLGFTFNRDPAAAAAQLIPVLGAMAGAIKLLRQGDAVEAKADVATAQSQDNGAKLAVVADAVAENTATTESTHKLVNGQSHAAAAAAEENALLRIERAEHKAEMAALAELTRTALAELAARSAGIAEGRAQMAAEVPQET